MCLCNYRNFRFKTFSNIDQPFLMQHGIIMYSSRIDDSPVPSVYSYRNRRNQNECKGFIFDINMQNVSAFFRYVCIKVKALDIFRLRRTHKASSWCSQKNQTALIAKAATRYVAKQVAFTYHSCKIPPEHKIVCYVPACFYGSISNKSCTKFAK